MARFKRKNKREFTLTQKAIDAYLMVEREAKAKGFKRVVKLQDDFWFRSNEKLPTWGSDLENLDGPVIHAMGHEAKNADTNINNLVGDDDVKTNIE